MLDIQEHIVLSPFTTFHIGGPADYFVKITSKEELIEAVTWAEEKQVPFFILGQGANILVGDKGYRGLVIKNEAKKCQISNIQHPISNEVLLTVESGAVVADIIAQTSVQGLSGFEHFAGIPSSIGGALWQNLHFLSPDRTRTVYIAEILESAEILTYSSSESEGRVEKSTEDSSRVTSFPRTITVGKDYFNFSYDYSSLHDSHDVVLSATFKLINKPKDEIQKVIDANLLWRQQKHPENATTCSAGSVFKKIEGHGAGRLIEQVGLKGHQIGGAQISEKHANFIVNTGNATAKDVRDLISLVEEKVKEQLGLAMQPEISFVGEF